MKSKGNRDFIHGGNRETSLEGNPRQTKLQFNLSFRKKKNFGKLTT